MTTAQIIEVGKALLPYLRTDITHAELGTACHDAVAALNRTGGMSTVALEVKLAAAKAEINQLHARLTCMCGNDIDKHTGYEGHTSVSMYDYALDNAKAEIARLRAALDAANNPVVDPRNSDD